MAEELKKPECPFCYISCNDPNCCVVGCDGTKEICNKALYCGIYPYAKFCTPDSCKEQIKAYFDERVRRKAGDLIDKAMHTIITKENMEISLTKEEVEHPYDSLQGMFEDKRRRLRDERKNM